MNETKSNVKGHNRQTEVLNPAKKAVETTLPPRRRTRFGVRRLLEVAGRDPNFYYRFEPDEPGNIAFFKEMGFVPVTWEELAERSGTRVEDMRVGDSRVDQGNQIGSIVTSNSMGVPLVLLKQPKEYREEDEAEYQKLIDRTEAALQRRKHEVRSDELIGDVVIQNTSILG